MLDVKPKLEKTNFPAIKRADVDTLQLNLGYLCNLSCTHCHVNAGPTRKELMTRDTIDTVLQFIDQKGIKTLDLTGGAPELNPDFKYLIREARARGVHVMDRCNLTVLLEPGQEGLADFLAEQKVEVVASLPCYTEDNVDKQRGKGVFDGSIKALKLLNELGYGIGNPELKLSLVYNPNGAFLPPPQDKLKQDYKEHLDRHFGISFDDLFTITNMPIARFGSTLLSKGTFDEYLDLLKANFDSKNLQNVMCRSILSVDWEGYVFDCDFNQMLDMPLRPITGAKNDVLASDKTRTLLSELVDADLAGHPVYVKDHCYGCTAGQGSSCGGALE
jgi:radical SAM/Cys-rich protein